MDQVQGLFGLLAIVGLAWIIGGGHRRPTGPVLRMVGAGLAMQLILALALLKLPPFKAVFLWLNSAVLALQEASRAGTSFVFGYLGGGQLPFTEPYPGASFVLAFQALPLILVMSALSALLFYWRVLPLVVKGFSLVLQKSLGIGGAVGVSAAANVFVGMVEAPLFIRPYLKSLTRSELFMVMTCGMATIAGTVMVLYAGFLANVIPDAVGHILTASLISAPAAIMVARLMVPEEQDTATEGTIIEPEPEVKGSMEAITKGTTDGIQLLINVIAMLVVLVALVSLLNAILGLLPVVAEAPLTLQRIAGWLFAPLAWLIGIPWAEAQAAGALLGTKVILNELIAYLDLSAAGDGFSERSRLILVYALCGFANFGSLGIMIGGLGTMAPERRADVVALGLRSILSGLLATCMTGAVVGLIL